METAIDAGNMHALVDAMRAERDAWREKAERLSVREKQYGMGDVASVST